MTPKDISFIAIAVLSSVLATLIFFILQQLTESDITLFIFLKSLTSLVYVGLMYLYLFKIFLPDSELITYLETEPIKHNKHLILTQIISAIVVSIALVASIPRNPIWAFYLLVLFLHGLDYSINQFSWKHNITKTPSYGLLNEAVQQQTVFGLYASCALLVLTVTYSSDEFVKNRPGILFLLILFNLWYFIPFAGFIYKLLSYQDPQTEKNIKEEQMNG